MKCTQENIAELRATTCIMEGLTHNPTYT